jgi:DNA-binding transcriptional LysR family regulator
MEARELRYFLALAEELHFSHAARRLEIAPSALSRAVHKIETDLGVQLFVRDTHGVRLTGTGEALVGRSRDALASLEEALARAREAGRRALEGALSVGVSPLLRHRLAPAILERFAAAYPAVRVERRDELSGPLVQELRERRIDVALAFCPTRHHDLAYEPIRDAQLAVLLPAAHPLAERTAVSLDELREDRFLLPSATGAPGVHARFDKLSAAAGFHAKLATRTLDYDEGMVAVREGLGVAPVSRFLLEDAPAGTALVALDPPVAVDFELVHRSERPAPELARFVDAVREVAALDLDSVCESTNGR